MTVVGCRSSFTDSGERGRWGRRRLTFLDKIRASTYHLFHTKQSLLASNVVCTANFPFLFDVNRHDHLLKEVIVSGHIIDHITRHEANR